MKRREAVWLLTALLLALACADFLGWHPGAAPDEMAAIQRLQAWRDGLGFPWILGRGCLTQFLQLCVSGLGSGALHLPAMVALILETFFLWSFGRRWLGEQAAFFACLANLASAFTLLRLRSLLCFSLLPCQVLGMLWVLAWVARPWQALLFGLAAGLLAFDYEAWMLALPVLAIFFFLEKRQRLRLGAWALAGLGLGLAVVLACSWPHLRSYGAARITEAGSLNPAGLLHYLLGGGASIPFMGLDRQPVVPPWFWPGLLAGAWACWKEKKARWVAWIACGLAPVFFLPLLEPNREIVAWTGFCLLAGLGWSRLAGLLAPSRRVWIVAAWVLLGAGWEGRAYAANMRRWAGSMYGESVLWREAAAQVRAGAGQRGVEVIGCLEPRQEGYFKFMLDQPKPLSGDPLTVVLVPGSYAPAPPPEWGVSHVIRWGSEEPSYVVLASPAFAARMRALSRDLAGFVGASWIDGGPSAPACQAYLSRHPLADPMLRGCLWDRAVKASLVSGSIDAGLIQAVLSERLETSSFLIYLARSLAISQPATALLCVHKARLSNPHYRWAWQMETQLLAAQGRAAEAADLLGQARRQPSEFFWDL